MAQEKTRAAGDRVTFADLPLEPPWEKDPKDPYLWLHKPTGMYYVRKRMKGKKPLFKKTGYTSRTKAKTKAQYLMAEWLGNKRPESQVILFGEFAEGYLGHLEKTKLRPRTKEQARIYIRELIEEMGANDIRHIHEGFFEEWLADFRLRKSRTTFMDYAKYLSKVMKHAYRKQVIERLPEFPNPDPPKKTGRVYTREEIEALLQVATPQLELQMRLCLQGFMRLREMLFLTWERIDLSSGLIRLGAEDVKTGSKTGEGREFYLHPDLNRLLAQHQGRQKRPSRYVFPSPQDPEKPTWSNKTAWRKAKRKAGIERKARWHDLRHTAISWALTGPKPVNPLMVSYYAGVSLRTIQRVYLKVKPEHTRDVATCIEI